METLITVIAVNDFIFITNISGETYFTVSFEDIGELGFSLHKVLDGGFEEFLFLSHIFGFVLLDPHAFECFGKHFLIFISESVFEVDEVMLPCEERMDLVDFLLCIIVSVLLGMWSLIFFLNQLVIRMSLGLRLLCNGFFDIVPEIEVKSGNFLKLILPEIDFPVNLCVVKLVFGKIVVIALSEEINI